MPAFLNNNGLTFVLLVLFAFSILGQWLTGWRVAIEEALRHGQHADNIWGYARSPQFLSSVFENWESGYLQM